MICGAVRGVHMIQTKGTVIETYEPNDIMPIISSTLNVKRINRIKIDPTYSALGSCRVDVDWDIPSISFEVDELIARYIVCKIEEGTALYQLNNHQDSCIIDLYEKWYRRAVEKSLRAKEALQQKCLGD